jgi:hypothetical protein
MARQTTQQKEVLMFSRRAILFATNAILLCVAPGFAAKGRPVSCDTPANGYLYPFNVDPVYHMGADGKLAADGTYAPYGNGADGIRSVFNGGDYLLDLDYSRSATRRISRINLGEPAVDASGTDVNGLKPPVMGIWSNSTMNLKVAAIQNLAVSDAAVPIIAWFDMVSANGKRWYRVYFNGKYGASKVNITHPSVTEWYIEAPKDSIARVIDLTDSSTPTGSYYISGKNTPIGSYYVDFQLKVTLP